MYLRDGGEVSRVVVTENPARCAESISSSKTQTQT